MMYQIKINLIFNTRKTTQDASLYVCIFNKFIFSYLLTGVNMCVVYV